MDKVSRGECGTANAAAIHIAEEPISPKAIVRFFAKTDIAEIDEEKLKGYQLHRSREGRKPSTINGEVGTIMVLLNWARPKGWVHTSPDVKQLPIERKREILPNKNEVAQIIGLLPKRLQALVLVLACTGFRRGEVFNLPWHHVDLEKGTFRIAEHRDWKPKTPRSERVFKFTGRALEAVRALPRDGYYVFPGKKEWGCPGLC